MNGVQARLSAILASFVVATLGNWGVAEIDAGFQATLQQWFSHSFELMLLLGYAFIHPRLERRDLPVAEPEA